jgi:hypothetical protein
MKFLISLFNHLEINLLIKKTQNTFCNVFTVYYHPCGASALPPARFVGLEFAVVTTASFARLALTAHCLVQFAG